MTEYETKILRHLNGEDMPKLSWGAAMSVAVNALRGMGYASLRAGRYEITDKGREALSQS